MSMKHPPWITMATLAYCMLASKNILTVWWTSPLEHCSWIAMLVWLVPVWGWTATLSTGQGKGVR